MNKGRRSKYLYEDPRALREGAAPLACGKLRYASRSVARAAAKAVRGSGREAARPGLVLGAYFCHRCDAWHVGHRFPHLAPTTP